MSVKPFIKWAGGKTQILQQVLDTFPTLIAGDYYEPFLGGGSVLLGILSSPNINIVGKVRASDLNPILINTYKDIQTHPNRLIEIIQQLTSTYDNCEDGEINRNPKDITEAMTSKESYYYWIRKEYNKSGFGIQQSSMFIFLNKTCFRGLYREGPNGFNVPYGHYKSTPTVVVAEHILTVSRLIQNVIFTCQPFEKSLTNITSRDFVYLDPPYAPETDKSFVAYTKDGFGIDKHQKLFKLVKKIPHMTMSNARVELVTQSFEGYRVQEIECKRSINSKNPKAKTMEVLITKP